MPSLRGIWRSRISGRRHRDVDFHAVSALFTAVKAVGGTLEELKRTGTPKGRDADMVSYAEFSSVVGQPFHQNWADRFGG
jgi:hypothetical protein